MGGKLLQVGMFKDKGGTSPGVEDGGCRRAVKKNKHVPIR